MKHPLRSFGLCAIGALLIVAFGFFVSVWAIGDGLMPPSGGLLALAAVALPGSFVAGVIWPTGTPSWGYQAVAFGLSMLIWIGVLSLIGNGISKLRRSRAAPVP
jgi:hypothetical protein